MPAKKKKAIFLFLNPFFVTAKSHLSSRSHLRAMTANAFFHHHIRKEHESILFYSPKLSMFICIQFLLNSLPFHQTVYKHLHGSLLCYILCRWSGRDFVYEACFDKLHIFIPLLLLQASDDALQLSSLLPLYSLQDLSRALQRRSRAVQTQGVGFGCVGGALRLAARRALSAQSLTVL